MGSVSALTTTGDNDPELEPTRYWRHYLYCDACGSFELEPWMAVEDPARVEAARRRLAQAAIIASPLVLAAAWEALDLAPPSFLDALVAGSAWMLFLVGMLWRFIGTGPLFSPQRFWSFVVLPLLAFPGLLWLEWLSFMIVAPWVWVVAGSLLVAGLLIARARLGPEVEYLGLRCRRCGATYANGSALFTDLDANPRDLTIDDVPRPLGSTPFERGATVDGDPPAPPSRLPA